MNHNSAVIAKDIAWIFISLTNLFVSSRKHCTYTTERECLFWWDLSTTLMPPLPSSAVPLLLPPQFHCFPLHYPLPCTSLSTALSLLPFPPYYFPCHCNSPTLLLLAGVYPWVKEHKHIVASGGSHHAPQPWYFPLKPSYWKCVLGICCSCNDEKPEHSVFTTLSSKSCKSPESTGIFVYFQYECLK